MLLGERLKELRIKKGGSQAIVADYLGVTKQAYSLYELGKREPDYETLLKLGEYFDVSVDYILAGNENQPIGPDQIKFALWGGDAEIVDEEMLEDVKDFAKLLAEKKKRKMRDNNEQKPD